MRFARDESGAVLLYVTIIIAALVGVVGLALDSGRLFSLRHEVQAAADAAAIAGAWQLDGTLAGSQQADAAARTTPVVVNGQKFGATPGNVAIASSAFFRGPLPADDDTPLTLAPPPYDYIQVTTSAVTHNTILMRILGAPATTTVTGQATARKGAAICQVTPLFMCSPDPVNFDPSQWIGRQVWMKAGGGGGPNQWLPGNWGLLDTPGGSQSTPALGSMIAGVNGLPQCISTTGAETKPGNVASLFTAFNVRFDIYENPQSSAYRGQPGYPPAENVFGPKDRSNCDNVSNTQNTTKLPRDIDLVGTTRFGNGQWNCLSYWAAAHPGPNPPAAPSGCSSTGGVTRFETYRHEIFQASSIPDLSTASPVGGNGNPSCYTGGPIPPTPTAPSQLINDRRIFTIAVTDCTNGAGGNQVLPIQHYLSMFITEPAESNQGDVYMEIVGYDTNGGGGLVPVQLREWVELVR